MKLVVVTASIGENRNLLTPSVVEPGVEWVCFADRKIDDNLWRTIRVDRQHAEPVRDAKRYKVLIDQFVEADASIWIDRHCRLLFSPLALLREMAVTGSEIGLAIHRRGCIYHEARICRNRKKDSDAVIDAQIAQFRSEGWPPRAGLFYGGFVVRRHTEAVRSFNELWWEMIEAGSRRDQLSLPVAVRRSGVKLHQWPTSRVAQFFKIGVK